MNELINPIYLGVGTMAAAATASRALGRLECVAIGAAAGLLIAPALRYLRDLLLTDAHIPVLSPTAWARPLRYLLDLTLADNDIPVLSPTAWARRLQGRRELLASAGKYAFYSSVAGAITTDPTLMSVPIDDHVIVRGHAVFDTVTLRARRLYRLQIHLARLLASAAAARLPLPFGAGEADNIEAMTRIICATVAAAGVADADVRYWLTAGPGNLGVTPDGCTPAFYVLVFGGLPSDPAWREAGLCEATVPEEVVPLKPPHLAELKSTNYMLNALTAMAAQDRGGTYGIAVDRDGFVKESCVLNVAVVSPDGVLSTPPFAGILAGTTIRKAMALAQQRLVASGTLTGVSQAPVSVAAMASARELMLLAGDTHVYGVVKLDGRVVGDGCVGPVTREVRRLLEEEAEVGTDDHTEVPGL